MSLPRVKTHDFYRVSINGASFLSLSIHEKVVSIISIVLGCVSISFYQFHPFWGMFLFVSTLSISFYRFYRFNPFFANFKIIVTNTWRVESNKEPGFL